MFTGLVEEIGIVTQVENIDGGKRLHIAAKNLMDDAKVNDSICIDGVCLTVTKTDADGFWIDAVGATMDKTTFAAVQIGTSVNLERSLKLSDRLGGHFVQGHVNGVGKITELKKLGENYYLEVIVPKELERYLIKEGSIAIDGISLTIADLKESEVGISIIPHTWGKTTVQFKKKDDEVNIEIDVIAKYIEKLMFKKENSDEIDIPANWIRS